MWNNTESFCFKCPISNDAKHSVRFNIMGNLMDNGDCCNYPFVFDEFNIKFDELQLEILNRSRVK